MKLVFRAATAAAAICWISGCQTVNNEAPDELKAADASIRQAKKENVEDYMPRALEGAQRKLDHSVALLKESREAEAIQEANSAKAIADGATKLVADMHSYDANSRDYLSQSDRAAQALTQNAQLKAQVASLQGENDQLTSENEDLASQPPETEIPPDFKVGKALAFFATGSAVLDARYRADIEQVARLVKENDSLELKLEGYADPRGSAAANQKLAQERIQAVAKALEEQGVDASRIHMVNVGATADTTTASGRHPGDLQLDRKVTATISSVAH